MTLDELSGFILSSKARKRVLKFLSERGPARPSTIAKELPHDQPYISRTLIDLKKRGVVKCLTPEKKSWRVYALTSKGEKIYEKLL